MAKDIASYLNGLKKDSFVSQLSSRDRESVQELVIDYFTSRSGDATGNYT